ncbi:conserved hypothetical protein [Leishmania mexicana MHOM/GT/2001/U1103]|uniref:Uncharacterized protein n=1 Tax=Leishmania mexicana (strain MHOM/GT/2001/U1103) TaxID=929439 RepID=E9B5N4_LEIMU|nr:conserved hypothetical protein [Leishmania mexicana MHOM/GT/2001/U1103]CBZ30554.1 conserved hypothetical protein [Leishmania mexicana MHOM/GT/2001/U1103]
MGSPFLGYSDEDYGLASVWGRLIFLSCITTGILYVLFGLFACRRLILRDARWLLMAILYFSIGVCHAFFTLTLLCFAIACVLHSFEKPMQSGEMIMYSGIMTIITMYFACGRKTILYSL